jgi:hypothetical protein
MKLLALLLSITVTKLFAQGEMDTPVRLNINTDSLVMHEGDSLIDVDLSVLNESGATLIFYRLLQPGIATDIVRKTELYCDIDMTGAGMVMLVFDSNGNPVYPMHWYLQDINHRVTRSDLDSAMVKWRIKALKATSVIKKNTTVNFRKRANLREHDLKRGIYSVQLIYFAGKKITNFVSEGRQKIDQKNNEATIFMGCIKSELCKLVVR